MEIISRMNEAFVTLDQMENESQAIIGLYSQTRTRGSQKSPEYSVFSRRRNRSRKS